MPPNLRHPPSWLSIVLVALAVLSYFVPGFLLSRYEYQPGVGVYVTVMAVVIAVMTIRKEPGRIEKTCWVVLIMALAILEIKNINLTTTAQVGAFSKISQDLDATKKGLDTTASGIQGAIKQGQIQFNATMAGVNRTLQASQAAQRNTQPFADLELVGVAPSLQHIELTANGKIAFNIFYKNVGNDTATHVVIAARDYVGPLDNAAFQVKAGKEFDKRWTTGPSNGWGVRPPDETRFFTFNTHLFTQPELDSIVSRTNTIYMLIRWSYRDKTGHWTGDNCFAFQDPQHDLLVTHPCVVYDDHRYRSH